MVNEPALIHDAVNGDINAFNRLVMVYQDMVFNQAYRVLGESDAAEDATQEAFISAFRKLKSYRGGSFRAWLLRIVTNECYDELRRRKRQPITHLEPLDDSNEEIESPKWLADHGEAPEDAAVRAELAQVIQNCISQLSPDFRVVVVLVDVQGMDYSEAAEVVGRPLGTIKSRLARARLKMRKCLQGFWELLPATYRLGGETQR